MADNRVEMIFNQNVEGQDFVEGEIHIWNSISTEIVSETSEVEIRFPLVNEEKKITVKLKPDGGSVIGKSGLANNEFNGDKITWTVDINTSLDVIDNAVLRDAIQPGLELDVDSIKVYRLNVPLNGTPTQGDELTAGTDYTITPNTNTENLEISFGNIDSAYRVIFTTDVTAEWDGDEPQGRKTFNNTANFEGTGVNQSAPASVQIRRGEPLNKQHDGYNSETQTITWEIRFNYDSREMTNPVLVDSFSTAEGLAMTLVAGSFQVFEVELNENGGEASSTPVTTGYTVTPTKDGDNDTGFRFQFDGTIDKPYKIRYQTEVTGKVFDDQNVTNEVTIEGTTRTRSATRGITQEILHKSNIGVDYAAKTTRWRVTFNGNNFEMENAVLEDMFPNDALTLLPETVEVKNKSGQLLSSPEDYIVEAIGGDYNNGFTISFVENVEEQYTIEYVTAFDPDVVRQYGFRNEATIEWFEELEAYEQTRGVTFNPNNYTNNNGFKRGSYNAQNKRITWDIGINYNLNEIENAVVVDFLENGQQLVPGSIEIFEMVIAPGGTPSPMGEALDPDIYNIDIVEDPEGVPGIRVTFNNPIDSPYWITFQTNLDGNNLIDETYHNTASLYDGGTKLTDLTASQSIKHGTEYVSKNRVGTGNSRFIDWQIWVNRSQAQIPAGAEIIDTPTNQLLVEESFTIYHTTVDSDGTVTKDPDRALAESEYTLEIKDNEDGSQHFDITFLNDFNVPYVIEYQSFIFRATGGDNTVDNTVQFKAEGIDTGERTDTRSVTVRLSSGAGTGSGMVTDLTVIKVDGEDGRPLEGASFSLHYKSSDKLVDTLTTGSNGEAVFENLLFTTYILREVQAPDGYQLDDTPREITLTRGHDENQITVINWRVDQEPIGRLGDYVWLDSNREELRLWWVTKQARKTGWVKKNTNGPV
jgi:uncharacterized surface anchored protein